MRKILLYGKMPMNKVVVFKWENLKKQKYPSGNVHKTNIGYDATYVNKHYESLCRVAKEDFQYICVTDDPTGLSSGIGTVPLWDKCRDLGGCYNRMYIFSKDMKNLFGDKFLTVDLDTTFTKDFSHLFNNDITTVHRTIRRQGNKVYHPGISLIVPDSFDGVWDTFYDGNIEENIRVSKAFHNGTDQAWFNYYLKKYDRYKDIKCWNGKTHGIYLTLDLGCKPLPRNCVIVSWAGPRDPYETTNKRTYPWLEEYLV